MLKNNIERDIKLMCIEQQTTQVQIAKNVGISPSYVNKIIRSKEQIINRTFLAVIEALGYDVEIHYVKK